jgi:hypothetical protein
VALIHWIVVEILRDELQNVCNNLVSFYKVNWNGKRNHILQIETDKFTFIASALSAFSTFSHSFLILRSSCKDSSSADGFAFILNGLKLSQRSLYGLLEIRFNLQVKIIFLHSLNFTTPDLYKSNTYAHQVHQLNTGFSI